MTFRLLPRWVCAGLALCWGAASGRADTRIHAPCIAIASHTTSMLPAIKGGERILIWPCDIRAVPLGKMVVVWNPERHINVLHRAIASTPDHLTLTTKGDALPHPDWYPVTQATLVGRAFVLTH